MDLGNVIALLGLALSFMGMVVYVSVRFATIESEVQRFKNHQDDFNVVRDMVYRIHAQNEILLSLKQSHIPT